MYPPGAFHFRVRFITPDNTQFTDVGFQSVMGLGAAVAATLTSGIPVKEASEAVNFKTLVLTRAVVDVAESPLSQWVFGWINKTAAVVLPWVYVELLNEQHEPYMKWRISNATPAGWNLGELNADKSEVLTETISLAYHDLVFCTKDNDPPPPTAPQVQGAAGALLS